MKKILLVVLAMVFLSGCASENKNVVKKVNQEVIHFVTFRTEPIGADVYVVDSLTGKDVTTFGKTPVRIMIFSNKIEIDSMTKVITCTNIIPSPNVIGFAYGKTKVEGVEFQFRFRMAGYFDEIRVERISVLNPNDTDTAININLKPSK